MVTSKSSVTLTDFNGAFTYMHGLWFLTNFELKRLFYTIAVGATFCVNVFNDSMFKLDIFG